MKSGMIFNVVCAALITLASFTGSGTAQAQQGLYSTATGASISPQGAKAETGKATPSANLEGAAAWMPPKEFFNSGAQSFRGSGEAGWAAGMGAFRGTSGAGGAAGGGGAASSQTATWIAGKSSFQSSAQQGGIWVAQQPALNVGGPAADSKFAGSPDSGLLPLSLLPMPVLPGLSPAAAPRKPAYRGANYRSAAGRFSRSSGAGRGAPSGNGGSRKKGSSFR